MFDTAEETFKQIEAIEDEERKATAFSNLRSSRKGRMIANYRK